MRTIIFLTIFYPLHFFAQSAFSSSADARSLALASTSLCRNDSWISINNPAILAFAEKQHLASAHRQIWNLKELQKSSLCSNFKIKQSQFGISLENFGFEHYNHTRIQVAYGKSINANMSLGLKLGGESIYLTEGNSGWLASAELYFFAKASKQLSYALSVKNPFNRGPKNGLRSQPGHFSGGLQFAPSEEITLSLETQSAWKEKLLTRCGIEYSIMQSLFVRFGCYYLQELNFSGGIGFNWEPFSLNMAYLNSGAWGSEICIDLNYSF